MYKRSGIEVVVSSELGVTYVLPSGREQSLVRSLFNLERATITEASVSQCMPYVEGMARWSSHSLPMLNVYLRSK